jgi:hypothetical protein
MGAAMAILGESLLALKVDGDVFKLWWVELHKWRWWPKEATMGAIMVQWCTCE